MGAEHLDGALNRDIQEIGCIAFGNQFRVLRKALQCSSRRECLEIVFAHAAKQRQGTDDIPIGLAHGYSPGCEKRSERCIFVRKVRLVA
jgi:hypothetical protein